MQHADGEILAARAAEAFGIPFTLSTMSICSIEDVAAHTQGAVLVPALRDARPRLHRAADRPRQGRAAARALVLTLDLQILGQRHKDLKNGLSAPPKPTLANLAQPGDQAALVPGHAAARKRRQFGNIVGHVKGVDEHGLAVGSGPAQQFDPHAELGRRRVDQEALGRQARS